MTQLTLGELRAARKAAGNKGHYVLHVHPDLIDVARKIPGFTPIERTLDIPNHENEIGIIEWFQVVRDEGQSPGTWSIEPGQPHKRRTASMDELLVYLRGLVRSQRLGGGDDAMMIDALTNGIEHLGWQLVPKEPTDAMRDAGAVAEGNGNLETEALSLWSAMLAAAPKAGACIRDEEIGPLKE